MVPKRINATLKDHHADALVVFNFEHSGQPGTRYLSGFTGSTSITVITSLSKWLLTDGRYVTQAHDEATHFTYVSVAQGGYIKTLARLLKENSIKTILIDPTRTAHSSVIMLQGLMAELDFEIGHNLLQELRMVKTEDEIAKIQASVDIATRAFERLLGMIEPGLTERHVANHLEYLMREAGADERSFPSIVASGINGAKPHAQVSEKKLEKGELITIDFGCFKNGYACDITRTIALGEPDDELKKIYEIVRESQQQGCDALQAGSTGKEIDAVCRQYITDKGYGKYFLHGTGHGLGMEVHEQPNVSAGDKKPLPEGAVVTVEPGIYVEGLGGVRIEDDLVVRKNSADNLTSKLPHDLIIL